MAAVLGPQGGRLELVDHGGPRLPPARSSRGVWSPPWGGAPAWEIFPCPAMAYAGYSVPWQSAYPQPYQYIGYRWLRGDGSTCSPMPSDAIWFFKQDSASSPLPADDAERSMALSSREHRVARIFYRMPPENGTVYYHDQTEYTGRLAQVDVRYRVAGRSANPPLPWESETLSISFDGSGVEARVRGAAYEYRIERSVSAHAYPAMRADITLTPVRKLLTPPDPGGLIGRLERTQDGKSIRVVFADRWAANYPGQSLRLRYVVKRQRRIFGDPKVAEGEERFPTAPEYSLDLSTLRLREPLKPGEEYYAEYSFQRLGNATSTEDESPTFKLPRIRL